MENDLSLGFRSSKFILGLVLVSLIKETYEFVFYWSLAGLELAPWIKAFTWTGPPSCFHLDCRLLPLKRLLASLPGPVGPGGNYYMSFETRKKEMGSPATKEANGAVHLTHTDFS